MSADGLAVGAVVTFVIDDRDWTVTAIGVELRNEIADRIGVAHTLFRKGAIDVPVGAVQAIGDAIVLAIEVDRLRDVVPAGAAGGAAAPVH